MCLKKIHCICFKFYFLESASCFLLCLRVVMAYFCCKYQNQVSALSYRIFCSEINHLVQDTDHQITAVRLHFFSTLLVSWILDIPPSENYVLLPMIQWVQTGFGIIAQRTPIVSCDFVTHCSSSDHGPGSTVFHWVLLSVLTCDGWLAELNTCLQDKAEM